MPTHRHHGSVQQRRTIQWKWKAMALFDMLINIDMIDGGIRCFTAGEQFPEKYAKGPLEGKSKDTFSTNPGSEYEPHPIERCILKIQLLQDSTIE